MAPVSILHSEPPLFPPSFFPESPGTLIVQLKPYLKDAAPPQGKVTGIQATSLREARPSGLLRAYCFDPPDLLMPKEWEVIIAVLCDV